MNRTPVTAWLWTVLWSTWILAVQGAWAAGSASAAWTPNLGVILIVAVAPKLGSGTMRGLVLVLCAAHAALSLDPPVAVAAGYLGMASVYRGVASTFQLEGLAARAVAAGLISFLLAWWLHLVQVARLGSLGSMGEESFTFDGWKSAAATVIASTVLAPIFGRLPGIRRLGGRHR